MQELIWRCFLGRTIGSHHPWFGGSAGRCHGEVDQPDEEGVIVYHLHVAESDMGRVIGKQGRIAKAIRVVMRAAATRCDEKIAVEID